MIEILRESLRLAAAPGNRVRLHAAAEHGALLVVIAALLDTAWLIPSASTRVALDLAVNAALASVAAVTWVALRRIRRLPIEAIVLALLVLVDLAIGLVAANDPTMLLVCAGYVLLLPGIVALVVPWRSRFHLGWLALHASLVTGSSAMGRSVIPVARPGILLALLALAVGLSVYGHLVNLRARIQGFAQLQRIGALHRAARRDQLRLQTLNRALETMTRTDELTTLRNRFSLTQDMPMVRARIDRTGERYALLMLDIDHFKAINDELGHFAGDQVLRRVATAIRAEVRETDLCFRFGGEEFLVIAPLVAGEGDAGSLAERVRRAVEALRIEHPGNAPFGRVTISVGATTLGRPQLGFSVDDWFRTVDGAMYRAKARGRNAVVSVAPPVPARPVRAGSRPSSSARPDPARSGRRPGGRSAPLARSGASRTATA